MSLSRITEDSLSSNAVTLAKITGIITPEKGGTGIDSVGTTGNVLTSNGTAWVSQTLTVANGDVTVQVFDTVGNVTWTKPANLQKIKVTVIGGGGDSFHISPGTGILAGGGGGGGAIKFIPAPTIPGPVVVTTGAGGRGNSGGNTSSFGAFVSATGGGAGNRQSPGAGGIGSNGDINVRGQDGFNLGPATGTGGAGALGFGFGGAYVDAPGTGFGGGGTGRYVAPATATGNFGLGANGAVIVEEFF